MNDKTQAFLPVAKVVRGEPDMADGTYPNARAVPLAHVEWEWGDCADGMLLYGSFDMPEVSEELLLEATNRGFGIVRFKDEHDHPCSLQQSSSAMDDYVWLGVDDAAPVLMQSDAKRLGIEGDLKNGWVAFPVPAEVIMHTRMHLSRVQVAKLLPFLHKFVATGEL